MRKDRNIDLSVRGCLSPPSGGGRGGPAPAAQGTWSWGVAECTVYYVDRRTDRHTLGETETVRLREKK